jgi:hypothetical protein
MAPSPQTRPSGQQFDPAALDYAVALIDRVTSIAGVVTFIDDLAADLDAEGVQDAIRAHDSAPVFDWLVGALSYQGIADAVAANYMAAHGQATWHGIEANLAQPVACPKLGSYWQFHGCRYTKSNRTCACPDRIDDCPLPTHDLRNGHLNQAAYSLYLFIRDIADGDLIGWIDDQVAAAGPPGQPGWASAAGQALLGPLRHVYGVSDKVLTMALSGLLIGAPPDRPHWLPVGAAMITVDTLVHNFLVRTGILARFGADHPYGSGCYGPTGCAAILATISARIDARQFNSAFPKTFPRFIQHAVWRYCAQLGLDICNGNKIDDRQRCANVHCHIYSICDRISLNKRSII